MINVNNQNSMQRHEQVIQLSDHVKNKLKQHQYLPSTPSIIESSDEFTEVASTDDDDNELDTLPLKNNTRPRCNTYTISNVKQPAAKFFTDRNGNIPIMKEKYQQQLCDGCIRRNHLIEHQREDLLRLYNQNKRLNYQLGSIVLQNRQYKNEIDQLNDHLNHYRRNSHDFKEKNLSQSKPKENDDEELTIDNLKRLRYEIQMYKRLVIAKEKQKYSLL